MNEIRNHAGRFRYETANGFMGVDGVPIPRGTLVKLTQPRNTFALGETVDGVKFVARAEWIQNLQVVQ